MNNFRIYFKETTTLEIGGDKITLFKGQTVVFRSVSDKDTKAIRKMVIKKDTMLFAMTDNTIGADRVIYGNKHTASKNSIDEKVKTLKGNKKDRFKNYVPKASKKEVIEEVKEEVVEESIEEPTVVEQDEKGVKITQKSLTENEEQEIIINEGDGVDEKDN